MRSNEAPRPRPSAFYREERKTAGEGGEGDEVAPLSWGRGVLPRRDGRRMSPGRPELENVCGGPPRPFRRMDGSGGGLRQ